MQINIFLIITTLLIVKPTVNGLFLAKFGVEQLPFAFILVALVAAIVSTVYSKLILSISLNKIFRYTLVSSIVCLIIFGILLRTNFFESIVLYIFYIWVAIFALLTTSQFWIQSNLLFDPREAKRIFGFIGAGAIAGGIFGGYLTSILSSTFSSEFLALVAAFFLTPALFINNFIWKNYLTPLGQVKLSVSQAKYDARHPIQIIKESRHLKLIAAIVGVGVMVAKLVDYQFGGIASELIQDPNELTAFFGFWFSTFNIISLGLQLFVTPRVVGTYGVGSSLFILPVTIVFSVIILLIFPEMLFSIVLLKMSDGGLKQSINKASMELLIFPVPQELKNKTKTFIDVFVDSLATGIIGIILIVFIKGLGFSYEAVGLLTLFLLAIWLYLANLVRKEYLRTITLKLRSINPKKRIEEFDLSNHSVIEGVLRVLNDGTQEQKLYMLQKIKSFPDERFYGALAQMVHHDSRDIRTQVVRNLYSYSNPGVKDNIRALTKDENQSVRLAAIEYLIRHESDKRGIINQFIHDHDPKIWGAALLGLAREARFNSTIGAKMNLKKLINDAIKKETQATNNQDKKTICISILKSVGAAHLPEFYGYIDLKLADQDDEIVQYAAEAAGETQSEFFFESLLVKATESTGHRHQFFALALSKYNLQFLELLKQSDLSELEAYDVKKIIPGVLKNIVRQSSVDYLFNLLSDRNSLVRRESIRALNYLKNNYGHLWFDSRLIATKLKQLATGYMNMLTILYAQRNLQKDENREEEIARDALVKLLEKRMDRTLEIIFRLLGLRFPSDDIFQAYKSLKSNKEELRSNALEMLDNILDKDLRKTLLPIIESTMLEQMTLDVLKRLKLSVPDESDCYVYLLVHGDERIILAVIYLLKHKSDITLKVEIENLITHENEKIKFHASELLDVYRLRSDRINRSILPPKAL